MLDEAPGDEVPLVLRPVGVVRSPVTDRARAARQADEDAPSAVLVLDPAVAPAVRGLAPGDRVVVVTWLHLADRSTLTTTPRDDPSRPEVGVFATRSPDRPNPIGLHPTVVTAVDGARITVAALEAVDGTPVLDLKLALGPVDER